MKISYNWLKNYIKTDLSITEISTLLTDIGLEIEGLSVYEEIEGSLDGLVVGQVKSCEKVEGTDHLQLTEVDVAGENILQIVCGAPNVAAGQKVLVALPQTTLYPTEGKSFTIKKTKIRGVESSGMICAEDEIGLGKSHDGIMILSPDEIIGKNAADLFQIQKDYVFEIGLTPNRSDAMSHIGVARDLYAAIKHRMPEKKVKFRIPEINEFAIDNNEVPVSINIENKEACIRYSGLTLNNVNVGESPRWLKNYLNAVGLRPLNSIVDITQFVMLESGQPLHAFDYDKIKNSKIFIKNLPETTEFTTLDNILRKLSSEDLMICNEQGGMCIAGVFGGSDSGVSFDTKRVFLESACFHPVSVRKTAKRHDLHTDASFRFERGTDPEMTIFAAKRAALLMKEICNCSISSELLDEYPKTIEKNQIHVNIQRINAFIGHEISATEIENILNSLDFKIFSKNGEEYLLEAPLNKVDVTREADVSEEILRIYGYNNIPLPEKANTVFTIQKENDPGAFREFISMLLSDRGLNEIMCNSLSNSEWHENIDAFNKNDFVYMLNPLSRELNIMRPSMISGILQSIAYNINRRNENLQLFEIGRIYKKLSDDKEKSVIKRYEEKETLAIAISGNTRPENWKYGEEKTTFYHLKEILNHIFLRLGIENDIKMSDKTDSIYSMGASYEINEKKIAEFGILDPKISASADVDATVCYAQIDLVPVFKAHQCKKNLFQNIPKYPEVRRDLSLLLNKNIAFEKISKAAFIADKKILKEVNLFDVYTDKKLGDDKKSYVVSFVFQREDKTLTDKETDKSMERISKSILAECNAEIR